MAHFSCFLSFIKISPFVSNPACIASISMGLESKERLENGIFGILPALTPSTLYLCSQPHRQLQKRERTGKEYGCFLFV